MKRLLSLTALFLAMAGAAEAGHYRLRSGQTTTLPSGDTVTCMAPDSGPGRPRPRPIPVGGPTCMIHYVNSAFHLYAVENQTTTLDFSSSIDTIIDAAIREIQFGSCNRSDYDLATCTIAVASYKHHVYMESPYRTTTVYWFDSREGAVNLVNRLRGAGLCR